MQKKNNDTALKSDFLAAYHSILFSNKNHDDPEVERRRLAVKYLTASKLYVSCKSIFFRAYERVCNDMLFYEVVERLNLFIVRRIQIILNFSESEDATALLLDQGLQQYQTLLERTGLIDKLERPENKDRVLWKSTLKDVQQAVSLVKPLRCQRNSSDKVCAGRNPVDRDVENIMQMAVDRSEGLPLRKIPSAQLGRVQPRSYERSEQTNAVHQRRNNLQIEARIRRQRTEEEDCTREDNRAEQSPFRTAKVELQVQQQQRAGKKSLGGKASVNSKFVCPLKRDRDREDERDSANATKETEVVDDRLKGIDEKLIELVRNEIMDSGSMVSWDDVAGLEHAKKIIKEIVVLPMLRPDIFTGLRRPPKGILLFGPPGTGKTLIGKCIASQSKSTFFSISASSLTSKWIGEGEKMVRALFAVARVHQPSVIFIDEIDSLLTQRSETEHESSRRIKTEFLVQLDGAATGDEDRILVIGATNRPQELDEAARRRFVKRLYVPLPEFSARRQIVENLLAAEEHELTDHDIDNIAHLSEHYSGADMTNLCKEASMGPIRSIPVDLLENIRKEDVRRVTAEDFSQALSYVRPSVSQADLGLYVNWDRTYGSGTSSLGKSKPSN